MDSILVDSPQDIVMNSAHPSGSTSSGQMSGVSAGPSLQHAPKSSEGRRSQALTTRTDGQESQGSLRRSESSELSSLLSQDDDFLTGRSSGSPSEHSKIKLKVTELQRRYSSSRLSLASRGGDALNDQDESPDDPEDSDSEFELDGDEVPISSASRPRPSRIVIDLHAVHARNARLTRRASMPNETSRLAANAPIGSKDIREREERRPQRVIAQLGEKFDGGTVTKRGKGWIVIEESDDEEVSASNNPSDTASPPAIHPPSPEPRAGKKRKRKRSGPHAFETPAPSLILEAQPPPAKKVARSSEKNAPDIGELRRLVIRRLSESLKSAGCTSDKRIPWRIIPEWLRERDLYAAGFPEGCVPVAENDEVNNLSSPSLWNAERVQAMLSSLNQRKVSFLPRPSDRIVLFETIKPDGSKEDSTCGFSAVWVAAKFPPIQPPSKKRPELKLVIPNTGERTDKKTAAHPTPRAKPTIKPNRKNQLKTSIPTLVPPIINPIAVPAPIITVQPPTPPEELVDMKALETIHEGPATTPSSPMLPVPPTPPTQEPAALPPIPVRVPDAKSVSSSQPLPRKFNFRFSIPPKAALGDRKAKTHVQPEDSSSTLTEESEGMEVSPTFLTGIPLTAILDGPIAAENAARATAGNNKIRTLPKHLQPVVAGGGQGQLGSITTFSRDSVTAATEIKKSTVPDVERMPPIEGNGFINKVSKRRLAESVRMLLRRLFESHGLSSSNDQIPWANLPQFLANKGLYISGWPAKWVPNVKQDQVIPHCGIKTWSQDRLLGMIDALEAREITVHTREPGRRVLFHFPPSDDEMVNTAGQARGRDSTIGFSEAWLERHMGKKQSFSTENPQVVLTDEMSEDEFPSSPPLSHEVPAPQRFGKMFDPQVYNIEYNSSDELREDQMEYKLAPEPPWKRDLEYITRPKTEGPSEDGEAPPLADAHDSGTDEDQTVPFKSLLPRNLPFSLQDTGRVYLRRDDVFEWTPNPGYYNNSPPNQTIWKTGRGGHWKFLNESRQYDTVPSVPLEQQRWIPDRISGRVLEQGKCEWDIVKRVWECNFPGRQVFGRLVWANDLSAWEWLVDDARGQKWLPKRIGVDCRRR